MNLEQRGIVTLLKSAVTGECLPLPADFSLEAAMPIVEKHSIVPMVYLGAVQCGIDQNSPLMQQLFMKYYRRMMRSEKQMKAVKQLTDAFDAAGIEYMPLKGCNLKALYPKPELRQMGDADILIREAQYDQIVPILEAQQFEFKSDINNVVSWTKPALLVELHRSLHREDHTSLNAHLGDGWQKAQRASGTRYALSHEDEYLFVFAHFVKHFCEQGIGCRHVVDLWLYRRHFGDMDNAYIRRTLAQMQLLAFHENMEKMLAMWFEGGPDDANAGMISDFVFDSGLWGKWENYQLWRAAKRAQAEGSAKAGYRKQLKDYLMPPLDYMQDNYPVLKKAPWLLPAMWPVRIVRVALFERGKIARASRKIEAAEPEKLEDRQQVWEKIGLSEYRG